MATLSLPTLLRAARKPKAQGFTLLRDVLRKRRARAAERERRPGTTHVRIAADPLPAGLDPRPEQPDPGPPTEPTSPVRWERYFTDRGIRVETLVPARELSPRQATTAAVRMIPALAALSARARGAEAPGPLSLSNECGTLIYLPAVLTPDQTAALAALHTALNL
ncbi:MAG TPA: hypothetical protein VFT45_13165 [Longimicrobium sp.]|nr:hypothetical protein [Longimicrobium sp.]